MIADFEGQVQDLTGQLDKTNTELHDLKAKTESKIKELNEQIQKITETAVTKENEQTTLIHKQADEIRKLNLKCKNYLT